MEISIAWDAILKLMAVGVLTYVIAPVLLSIRDSVLWFVITRFIYNTKVKTVISDFSIHRAWIDSAGITPFRILGSGENTRYYLNEREVEAEIFVEQKALWEKFSEQTAEQEAYLESVERRLDRLLKHYKQDEQNPIRSHRERLYKSYCESLSRVESEGWVKGNINRIVAGE